MNKPPVLSDKRMIEVARECWRTDRTYPELVAITQRDADVEYYEKEIAITPLADMLLKCRQDTAREIFEEIEDKFYLIAKTQPRGKYESDVQPPEYQSLKDKFLKEQK